jgi:hypothetical protein
MMDDFYSSAGMQYRADMIRWYENCLNYYIMLPVVLYGCETWSLTLRDERRVRVFEDRVLGIFGPKWDEMTGEWTKIYNEELSDLYCSHNI